MRASCCGNLANEMSAAGYSEAEAEAIRAEVAHYAAVRDEVKLGAGEDVDFKQYEAGMRFLLDTYIQADASEVVADFKDTGLIQLIVEQGVGAIDKLPAGIKKDPEAVAETITNNMRKVIIEQLRGLGDQGQFGLQLLDPAPGHRQLAALAG